MSITDTEIRDLEGEFGVRLPVSYKRLLLDGAEFLQQPVLADRVDLGTVGDGWVLSDYERLRSLNCEFRDFWAEMEFNAKKRPFPKGKFLIGDVDGDLLALNTSHLVFYRVSIYMHEYGRWCPFALSIRHLISRLGAKITALSRREFR
jgi:hypothetical protein